jgi:IclR family acetate operon transcriptional repressor
LKGYEGEAVAGNNEGVRAVTRALDILKAFTPEHNQLSATELLTRLDLSRPTLYRLLYALVENGFLVSMGEPRRFGLGPAVPRLMQAWTAALDLPRIFEPVMRELWELSGETIALYVQRGDRRTCIAEIPSPQPLSFKRGVGYSERIVLGASGRAILAHSGVPKADLRRYAVEAGLDPAQYLKELEAVRRKGYAISRSELIPGAVSLAAPVFDGAGEVGGALVVFGPEVRLPAARIRELSAWLVEKAGTASALLGR